MSNQTTMKSLGEFSRDELEIMREDQSGISIFPFPECGVTVLIRNVGNGFADVVCAYQADDETKFRKNVGEYLVRSRLEGGMCTRMKVSEHNFEYLAGEIANLSVLC